MSDEELDVLAKYVRYLADRMMLRDWIFEVGYEKSQQSPVTIEVSPQQCEALIVIGEAFVEGQAEQRRYWIVHELLHPHLQPMRDCVQTLEPMLAQSWPFIRAHHDNGVEVAGHNLTRIIAPTLPTLESWYAGYTAAEGRRESNDDAVPESKRGRSRGVPASGRRRAV